MYIKKDNINKVVLTLNEVSTLDNPNYLMVFKNTYNIDSVEVHWMGDDTSSSTNRYNLFTIEENVTGSTIGGINEPISLMGGQYEYDVYESSIQTLDISGTTGIIIQSGILIVDDINMTYEDEVIPSQNNNTPSIYD